MGHSGTRDPPLCPPHNPHKIGRGGSCPSPRTPSSRHRPGHACLPVGNGPKTFTGTRFFLREGTMPTTTRGAAKDPKDPSAVAPDGAPKHHTPAEWGPHVRDWTWVNFLATRYEVSPSLSVLYPSARRMKRALESLRLRPASTWGFMVFAVKGQIPGYEHVTYEKQGPFASPSMPVACFVGSRKVHMGPEFCVNLG